MNHIALIILINIDIFSYPEKEHTVRLTTEVSLTESQTKRKTWKISFLVQALD